jgi:hypothetical protein
MRNRVLNNMKKGTTKETATEVCRNIYNAVIWNLVKHTGNSPENIFGTLDRLMFENEN